jgi:DNA repair protein RecO (recombination protein O)
MLSKTRGIVITYTKYRETSLIVKIYTEEFGLHSCIINGVRSKTSKSKIALFQPLTLLDLIIYYKAQGLSRISEVRCSYPYKSLSTDPKKSAIAFFLDEILYKTIKEETANYQLFNFIESSLKYLDETSLHYENFHLIFLLKLSSFLGFSPGELEDLIPGDSHLLNEEEKKTYLNMLTCDYDSTIKMDNQARRKLLLHILKFYNFHVSNFEKINSLAVLQEVLKN